MIVISIISSYNIKNSYTLKFWKILTHKRTIPSKMIHDRKSGNIRDNNNKWHNINWKQINYNVSRRQKEMVVAYRNNDLKEVFKIQEKIAKSFEGRALAVRNIITNKGSKTPGIDKVIWSTPAERYLAIGELRDIVQENPNKYSSNKIKRVWIPKAEPGLVRPLGIPIIIDRALQALIQLILDPLVEETSDDYSFGFRKYRGTHNFIQASRTILDKPWAPEWIFDADIKNCFGEISHDHIMKSLDDLLYDGGQEYVKEWITAKILDKGSIITPTKGTPQGGPISATLCNITLNGLQRAVVGDKNRMSVKERRQTRGEFVLRYADDSAITACERERLTEGLIPRGMEFLKESSG